MYLLNCFFIYSFLGFLLESIFNLITIKNFESGILFGPWTPIYGVGAILTIRISNKIFKNMHKSKVTETIITFLILTLTLTLIEWLGGTLIEKLFHITMWNYQNFTFNIGKYITIEMALAWGIISILVIYFIKPIIDKLEKKIPTVITKILTILFIIDLLITLIIKIKESNAI